MAKRPTLTTESFLAHLFSPKKNPLPTGLRARPLKVAKGRKVARVNAYNKLPAFKQEALKRSGLREKYLKGEATYTDARKILRDVAVSKNVVKPLRTPKPRRMSLSRARQGFIAQHLMSQFRSAGTQYNPATVYAGSSFIEDSDAETIPYSVIKERAKDPDYMITRNGQTFNPYWYH